MLRREGAVGVSSREAPLKSSRSFGLNIAVGRNGCPPLSGRGMIVPIKSAGVIPNAGGTADRENRSSCFALSEAGRLIFMEKPVKEKEYEKRTAEGI